MPDLFMDSPQGQEYYEFLRGQTAANNAFSAEQAEKQMQYQTASNAKAMDFEHKEAELNRDWQEMLSNTAYQRQVKDMLSAGLNPVLGIANSGASVPSGATGRGASGAGSKAEPDTSINGAMANFVSALINGETQRVVADTHAAATMEAAKTSAEASKYGSELAASASMYGAELNSSAIRYSAAAAAAATRYAADTQYAMKSEFSALGIFNQVAEWLDSGKASGTVGKLVKDVFEDTVGNTGLAMTLKTGKTFVVRTVNQLKYFWNDFTKNSQEIGLRLLLGPYVNEATYNNGHYLVPASAIKKADDYKNSSATY